jgi:hypothetical protein
MRYYDELARYEREGFEIIVDKTYEDIHPQDCFDDSCYDIPQICRDIDMGKYEWFMLRVRALVEGHELGSAYLAYTKTPAQSLVTALPRTKSGWL